MPRKPLVLLDDAGVSRLAREVARDIFPIKDILQRFQLSEAQFETVTDSKFFQVRLAEEVQLWNASDPLTIRGRVETKAATLVEDCLLEVYTLVHDRNQPMAAKVEALKWAARIAGMGEAGNAKGMNGEGQVKITINIGGKSLEFDKEKLPRDVTKSTDVVDLTPTTAG